MKGKKHLTIGVATGAGLSIACFYPEIETGLDIFQIVVATGIAGFGSLAPDIDHSRAWISSRIPKFLFKVSIKILLVFVAIISFFVIFAQQDLEPILLYLYKSSISGFLINFAFAVMLAAFFLKMASFVSSSLMKFRHRGPTHSLAFMTIVTAIAMCISFVLTGTWFYGLMFGWGWFTHLAADATTEMRLPDLFWPFA